MLIYLGSLAIVLLLLTWLYYIGKLQDVEYKPDHNKLTLLGKALFSPSLFTHFVDNRIIPSLDAMIYKKEK